MSDPRHMTDFFEMDFKDTSTDSYGWLAKEHRLKTITTDEELDKAIAVAQPLFKAYEELDQSGKDYLQVLSLLIQDYENKHHKIDTEDLDPVDALKFLMEEHDLNQSDIARILDSERGLVSEILSGKKSISKAKAVILAKHFNADVGMFIKETPGVNKKWGIGIKEPGLYVPAEDTRVMSKKYGITMGSKGTKPRTAPAKPKPLTAQARAKKKASSTGASKSYRGNIAASALVAKSGSTGKATKTTVGAAPRRPGPAKKKSKRA